MEELKNHEERKKKHVKIFFSYRNIYNYVLVTSCDEDTGPKRHNFPIWFHYTVRQTSKIPGRVKLKLRKINVGQQFVFVVTFDPSKHFTYFFLILEV